MKDRWQWIKYQSIKYGNQDRAFDGLTRSISSILV